MNLLQHQQKILLDKRPKIGLWHSCGAGKSATAIRWSLLRGNKILVVCPKSIVDNWKDNEIPKWGDRQADWTVISKETFRRDWLKLPKHDVVIYDECFLKGSMVLTPCGYKNIEDINIGDSIINKCGIDTVTGKSVKVVDSYLKVKLSNRKYLLLTSNHPVLTSDGWIKAGELKKNSKILTINQAEKSRFKKDESSEYVRVESIKIQKQRSIIGHKFGFKVYNLEIKNDPTYVVSDCIVHNCHFFSGYKSAMHKAGVNYITRHNIEYVIALTGTPYMSSPFNLYALGKLLGRDWNWYKFKSFFFKDVQMGPRRIPVPRKDKYPDIIKCYRDLGDFVKLEDIVDIPEHVYQNEYFRLNKAQNKEIDSLLDLLPIVRYSKIFQISNGTLKGDGYTEDKEIECDKMDRVIELIESTQKLAIICRHTLEIEAIKRRIKDKRVLTLTGATEERKKVIEAFNKIDDCVILIQASISEGYNLYTPVMVFYSLDWSLKNFVQMRARCVRMDYLRSIVYIHLIVKDTIDEAVYDCVVNKKMDFHAELYEKDNAL